MRRSVSFNLEPEVNFYKKRSAYVDPDVEPPKPFVLGPVPMDCIEPETASAASAAAASTPTPMESLVDLFPSLQISELPAQQQPQQQQPQQPARQPLLYEGLGMSPTAQEEIERDRAQEAAVRTAAIAAAYSQFTANDTPEQHTTPAATSSEQQPLSPFVLSPAASPLGRCEAKTPRV
jgi:hypothetical protein